MEAKNSARSRAVCSALNRLIVAGRGEIMALEVAARIVSDMERRARLREQIERRLTFQRDLTAGVTALGGVPATRAASGARLAAAARRVRELMIGPHDGDAYAVCARASARTATAYAKALKLQLPADVTFGLERQYAEVEWDCSELRRVRWGASFTPLPGRSLDRRPEGSNASAPGELDDARALEVWSQEGGSGAGRPSGANPGTAVAGVMN
jgi:uncharacterized protein (TIGR02284 family)